MSADEIIPGEREKAVPFRSVAVIGLGYIGLPTAAVMASRGVNVIGIDVQPHVVETVNNGGIHIVEPHLDETVRTAWEAGKLRASLEPVEADAFMVAVPTPITKDKHADVSYVMKAAEALASKLKRGDLVVLESTSPVGTTEAMVEVLAAARPDLTFPRRGDKGAEHDIMVAYCPERVLPGRVVEELVSNDRAIGGLTPACTRRAMELYGLFVEGGLVPTDTRSAELCKLSENAFRDVNIAFANELANVCEELDMDVWEVIRIANRHPRVNILQPGPGVGGHCIAVDPWFIAEAAPEVTPIIQSARRVNDSRPERVVGQVLAQVANVREETGKPAEEISVAFYGLAFKANIDDLRESPAIEVIEHFLKEHSGPVLTVEPHIKSLPESLSAASLTSLEGASGADVHVMLVEHSAFRGKAAPGDYTVDTRNVWS